MDFLASFDLSLLFLVISVGAVGGMLSGLFGIGGGIIFVPALFYLFDFIGYKEITAIHLAIGTSLAISIPATLSSFHYHHKKNNVDITLLKTWIPSIILGIFFGAWLGIHLEGKILLKIFSIYLIIAAIAMLRTNETSPMFKGMPKEPIKSLFGFSIGAIASLLGIGGGTITIPKMSLCGVPMKQVVGNAAAISATVCLIGTISHAVSGSMANAQFPYSIGYVNILAFLLMGPIGIVSARIGGKIAHIIHADRLRWVFALFMIFVSIKMMLDAF